MTMQTTNGHAMRAAEGKDVDASIMERVVIVGDLSRLEPRERVAYYNAVCRSVGLNPLTQPFQYINLNGKLTLYSTKNCTDQLRQIHGVSVKGLARSTHEGVHIVTAHVAAKDGREDEDIGAVTIANLKGEALANALMKATTKAKRRATLSICGLSFLDETEVDSVPNARPVKVDADGVIIEELSRPALAAATVHDDRAFVDLCERLDRAETAAELNAIARDAARAAKTGAITAGNLEALKGAAVRKRSLISKPAEPSSKPVQEADLQDEDADTTHYANMRQPGED